MEKIIRIGMDKSKHIFQLNGEDAEERQVLRKKLQRKQVKGNMQDTDHRYRDGSGGAEHQRERELREIGKEEKMKEKKKEKDKEKRKKKEGREEEGLCEAMRRKKMQIEEVKKEEQQEELMLTGIRQQLIERRKKLSNEISGYAVEFGVAADKDIDKIEPL